MLAKMRAALDQHLNFESGAGGQNLAKLGIARGKD
jgi:hypothetical protein